MKKKLKWVFAGALVVFALLQFTNPARTNPPVANDFLKSMSPPANIAAEFRAACYDCHSHETVWLWYSRIAPASWLVVRDVNEARSHLDMSTWPTNGLPAITRKLHSMSEEVRSGDMPPVQYKLIHRDARLTAAQRKDLADWLDLQATQAIRRPSPSNSTAGQTNGTLAANASPSRTLYLKNCAHCHGADADGDDGPDLHQLDLTDDQIRNRIRDGVKNKMTSFSGKLSASDIDTLVQYLRTLD